MSRCEDLSLVVEGVNGCEWLLPSTAFCRAPFNALIQLAMSSPEVAWYTRLYCGVMTSKQNLLSALRASRTDAIRKSMGSMCRSRVCFQLLYSDNLPWSRTIQNLNGQFLAKSEGRFTYLCHACLFKPLGSTWEPGLLRAQRRPSFRCCTLSEL